MSLAQSSKCTSSPIRCSSSNRTIRLFGASLVGYHTIDEARKFGDVWVRDEETAARLGSWFPPRTVSPTDNF